MASKKESKEKYKEAMATVAEAVEIRMQKAADYNGGPVTLNQYFPFGLKSYVQEINKKSLRLVSLAHDERLPTNESIRDSLLDLINYCSFTIEAIDKGDL